MRPSDRVTQFPRQPVDTSADFSVAIPCLSGPPAQYVVVGVVEEKMPSGRIRRRVKVLSGQFWPRESAEEFAARAGRDMNVECWLRAEP